MRKVVTGLFATRREAQHAVDRLVDAGFGRQDVSVLMSARTERRERPEAEPAPAPPERLTRAAEGASAGGTMGGVLGAILGGLAAVGSIAIPGVGLVAAGPIVAALAGAGAGGAAGTLVGALVGLGVSRAENDDADRERGRGGIVVAVEAACDHAMRAVAVLRGEGSIEVSAH